VDAWLIIASIVGLVVLVATRAFDWHRYSRGHFTAEFAIRGHGLFLSRTPDGTWWKLRLGKHDCATVYPGD
jgi:cupin superfamily acireductone dioxygenase involved in methionine salvage